MGWGFPALHKLADKRQDDVVEVGARTVLDVAARHHAISEGGIDDFEVAVDDRLPGGVELLEDVVVGDRGEDSGLLEAGAAHELVVGQGAANPPGDFGKAVAEGEAAFEPRSRRPLTRPQATPTSIVETILKLRRQLVADGLDAGADTISWHLEHHHRLTVSRSTIYRIIRRADLITPEPKKRPKSSYIHFQAEQPNETWQADFTHWAFADGTDSDIPWLAAGRIGERKGKPLRGGSTVG